MKFEQQHISVSKGWKRIALLLTVTTAISSYAQTNGTQSEGADWSTYNGDLAGTRFSPLTQVNTENVGNFLAVFVIAKIVASKKVCRIRE